MGEVMVAPDVRKYFSTDTSILELVPAIIAYPRNENDIRKTARFAWATGRAGADNPNYCPLNLAPTNQAVRSEKVLCWYSRPT